MCRGWRLHRQMRRSRYAVQCRSWCGCLGESRRNEEMQSNESCMMRTSQFAQWPQEHPATALDHPSQGYGLSQHSISNAGAETWFGDDVHLRLERSLQIDQQATEIKQAAAGFQVHEKIDIAQRIVRRVPRSRRPGRCAPPVGPQCGGSRRAWWPGVPAKSWHLYSLSKPAPPHELFGRHAALAAVPR